MYFVKILQEYLGKKLLQLSYSYSEEDSIQMGISGGTDCIVPSL